MPYISSSGQMSEARSPWRLSFITEAIWGLYNFVYLFFSSMFNPNKNSRGDKYTTDYRRPGGGGPDGGPKRRMGGFGRQGGEGPNAPPMAGGG